MLDPVYDDEPTPAQTGRTTDRVLTVVLIGFILAMFGAMLNAVGVESIGALVAVLALTVGPALLGAWMGSSRPVGAAGGFALVLFLSFLGLLIVGFIPQTKPVKPMKECPYCAERVQLRARVCRYCDRDIA